MLHKLILQKLKIQFMNAQEIFQVFTDINHFELGRCTGYICIYTMHIQQNELLIPIVVKIETLSLSCNLLDL